MVKEDVVKHSITLLVSLLTLIAAGAAGTALADQRVLLGERHVSDRSERDTIRVGADRGPFRGVQVRIFGSPVEFKRVVIHFENGGEQVFETNRILRRGGVSRVIDLEGGKRFIEKVVFHYEARSRGWKGAELRLFGIRGDDPE